ncbi:ATP synthase F0F1 subunit B [Actinomyces sp. S6-Spd3]|jgi:ATP synthase F0, B subunit|uniref:F0F1 ATP synthase subunit B n=1 Tax=unclassified Actinomyces TaxID=2609248 RepID=UPI0002A32DD0|nr:MULTISPECIES: F0F1 ATP synthase subunit B [unclassified Actinomyces]MBF1730795.1 F0F1 ATP synthase subunit B [Trueperella pyogenes]EKY14355.1 ATP synthase F0, B subunit [Actinomyces sp. oral taxon 181 str. F0379]KGE99266.1 ATP synthase F0F1 subunit B [Actinomyces sp. S6-Spd3]MBF0949325.1 F0F1 ATP synthase subunit B [Actinomyces sp.]MBF0954972.1 F0F1 ATP synthase subunit B [Actinomyces sp.]
MFAQLVPMSEGSVGGIGVVLPPLYEIFWSALILLVILLVVGLYALPRIYSMIDQRRDAIQEGLDNAEKAREDLSLASRKKDEMLRDAQAEAHQIREDARAQAQQIVAQARLDAQVEAQRVQDAAQRQILAERQAAQISLRSDVGLLASELAEKLVGEHLENTDLTARVVDRFLDELEAEEVPIGGVN